MSYDINEVAKAMKENVKGNPEKVTHFVRVYTLAKSIGELEQLPEDLQRQLEISAVVHSIEADDKTAAVKEMMTACQIDDETAMRVCYIVEHNDDYGHISGLDHQILVEAEMIVSFKEKNTPKAEIVRIAEKRFITNYGKAFLKKAFGV